MILIHTIVFKTTGGERALARLGPMSASQALLIWRMRMHQLGARQSHLQETVLFCYFNHFLAVATFEQGKISGKVYR